MIWEKVKRSSIHFLKHPLRTMHGLMFTPNRLKTFFSRAHLEELPDCQHPVIDEKLILSVISEGTVLDVGCGRGRLGSLLHKSNREIVGADIHLPYLAEAGANGCYSRVFQWDLERYSLRTVFKQDSFDVVLAVEVLEHLTHKAGLKLLKDMVFLARKQVVVTTPCGYYPYMGEIWAETHKSGWLQAELEKLGFRVTVHKGRLYDYFLAIYKKSA